MCPNGSKGSTPQKRAIRRVLIAAMSVLAIVASFVLGAGAAVYGHWDNVMRPSPSKGKTEAGSSHEAGDTWPERWKALGKTDFVVIGDSYHATDTTPYHEAAEQLADLSGMTLHNYSIGGTGWLATASHEGKEWTFDDQIDQAVEEAPEFAEKTAFVLVAGGYNDANTEAYDRQYDDIAERVRSGFRKLKRAFPKARIVYIPYLRANNPVLPDYFDMESVRNVVYEAETMNIVVVKYAWEWNLGQDRFFDAKRDPVHPCSEDGFRFIAQKEWDAIQGKNVQRTSTVKKFSGVTDDGLLRYSMNISLKKGKITGKIAVTPIKEFSPYIWVESFSENGSDSSEDYRGITPNSSLWNVFDGETAELSDQVSLEVVTSSQETDDAFVITGSGSLRKGKTYTVSFTQQ